MAVTITIDGTDRTTDILPSSLRIEQAIREVDTCRLTVKKYDAVGFRPEPEQEIVVTDSGTKVFAGYIKSVDEDTDPSAPRLMLYRCECKDYTDLLDRDLVADTYENQTIAAIIGDIVTNYAGSGLTTTNVDGPETVDYVQFNYVAPSKAIQELADLAGKQWYVDYDKDIHLFAKEDNAAPFSLSDTNGNYEKGTLRIKRDTSRLKNTVIVRGGEYEGSSFTEKFVGDGSQHTFPLAYRYRGYSLTLDSVSKTVGLDNIHDFTGYDALYNHQEKALRFDPTSPPANGAVIEFTGNALLPVIVKAQDSASVATYGTRAIKVEDRSIESKQTARDRATAELQAYAAQLSEGRFRTKQSGLRAGHYVTIDSAIRGFTGEKFVVNRLAGRMRTPDEMVWSASLVTTRTYSLLEFLQSLVLREGKITKQSENEAIEATPKNWARP